MNMTELTLDQLKTIASQFGYTLTKVRAKRTNTSDELSERINRLSAMTFATGSVKTQLMRTLKRAQKYGYGFSGVSSHQAMGSNGRWHSEHDAGYGEAVEYQRLIKEFWPLVEKCFYPGGGEYMRNS